MCVQYLENKKITAFIRKGKKMKKRLFKLMALMLCFMLVFTACSKKDSDEDDDRRGGRRTVKDTPNEDNITDDVTNVPTVAVTDVPAPVVSDENDIVSSGKDGDTTLLTATPTVEPTPEPTADPTPEPTADPTPEPTAEPTPEPLVDGGIVDIDMSDILKDGKSLSDEEVLDLAKAISKASNNEKRYLYLDSEMSMEFAGQPMDVIMHETVYVNGKFLHMNSYTDIYGSDTNIDTYSVGNDDGTTSTYISYNGGATWYKSNDDVVSMGSPFDSNYEEYANFLKDAYIVETSTGYTVTCQMRVEEEGFKLLLNCEIYLDTEGSVTGYKMFLDAPVEEEIEGMNVVMSKYDIDFETDCPEIELPAEALNAKEYDVNDLSGILDSIDY